MKQTISTVFKKCVEAIERGELIKRANQTDKEFHFQNWFADRLKETGLNFETGGRNSYPDFRMVSSKEGYELKGLAYPGRSANFDSNSQVPKGFHNGRDIYYVFGRYPKIFNGNSYPIVDFVICHGDFLNIDHEYTHENKNIKGFGGYGDIMIRDRKMYVAPTPFHLIKGLARQKTLILPSKIKVNKNMVPIGNLIRKESARLITGYSFNLKTNKISPKKIPNPSAGKKHVFQAWRTNQTPNNKVSLKGEQNATY